MKMKQMLASVLAAAMAVTAVPSGGLGGITAKAADETPSVQSVAPIRYRAVPSDDMTISADWVVRDNLSWDYAKDDSESTVISRYNTGGIPRSSMMTARNNIYVKLPSASDISKLVWWPDEDSVSQGHGENVHTGTLTRIKVYYTKADLSAASSADALKAAQWISQDKTEDFRFDSNTNDNTLSDDNEYLYGSAGVAHDIKFADIFRAAPEGVTGIRLEVLNTAGTYDPAEQKDPRDTVINGRELQVYTNEKLTIPQANVFTDFTCESGKEAAKLLDGDLTDSSEMSSLVSPAANETEETGVSPYKFTDTKYFANNNLYIDLAKEREIGKLTYVTGLDTGSIERCKIYVADQETAEGKQPDEIEDWGEPVWTNADNNVLTDWSEYDASKNALGNSHEAVFDQIHAARYVRVEVLNTKGSRTQIRDKWINVRRIYVYDAELVYTGVEANVALASRGTNIQAYTGMYGYTSTGTVNTSSPEVIINGLGNNRTDFGGATQPEQADARRWCGSAWMDGKPNNANYVILDLGGNLADDVPVTVRNLKSIKLRWAAMANAGAYTIETSDTCTAEGNYFGNEDGTDKTFELPDNYQDGWTKVAEVSGEAAKQFRLDIINADGQQGDEEIGQGENVIFKSFEDGVTELKRYVRLTITSKAGGPSFKSPTLKEFEIWGIREVGRLSTVELEIDEPVYHGIPRTPATNPRRVLAGSSTEGVPDKDEQRYHYSSHTWYKVKTEQGNETLEPLGENETFTMEETEESKTYVLKTKLGTRLPLGNNITAYINDDEDPLPDGSVKVLEGETCECGEEESSVIEVTYRVTVNNPVQAKKDLETVVNESKTIYEAGNKKDNDNSLKYTVYTWDAFDKAYRAASEMLVFTQDPGSSGSEGQEIWYLRKDYVAAKEKLTAAKNNLREIGSDVKLSAAPDVTIVAPVHDAAPASASLTANAEGSANMSVAGTKWYQIDPENGTETEMTGEMKFNRYKKHRVEITVNASSGYYFGSETQNKGIVRTAAGDDGILAGSISSLSDRQDSYTITYTFEGEQNPYDALRSYVSALHVGTSSLTSNTDADGTRVYTAASWADFQTAYTHANRLAQNTRDDSNLEQYAAAKADLEQKVKDLAKAAETCECATPGTFTNFADKVLTLTDGQATENLNNVTYTLAGDCLKHEDQSGTVTFTLEEGNTAGASLDGKTLTASQEGTVTVIAAATVTREDSAESKTDQKEVTFTVQKEAPCTCELGEITGLSDENLVLNNGSVTKTLNGACAYTGTCAKHAQRPSVTVSYNFNKDESTAAATLNGNVLEVTSAGKITIIATASTGAYADGTEAKTQTKTVVFTISNSGEQSSEEKLRSLMEEIAALNDSRDLYTVDTWNAVKAVYDEALELLGSGSPDEAACAEILSRLQKKKGELKTKQQDLGEANSAASQAAAAAEALIAAGQGEYSKASWDAFMAAYNALKNPSAGADASEIRRLTQALIAAQGALKKEENVLKTGDTYTDTKTKIVYRVLDAGKLTAAVKAGKNKKAKTVKIPNTIKIKGKTCKVVQIDNNAFKGYNKMTKLTIGKNVTTIGKKAFMNAKKLKNVIIQGKALKKIQKGAFKSSSKSVKVKWPKGLKAKARKTLKNNLKKQGLKVK